MNREIEWGTTRIPYVLDRSARKRTLSIRVLPGGEVEVVAPVDAPLERIEAIVRRKAKWIVDRKRRAEDVPPAPSAREYESGETFLYLGRQYRLRVRKGAEEPVKLRGRLLEVGGRGGEEAVRERLVEWYRAHASRHLPARVERWAPKLGVSPRAVLLREPKRRWGSCDAARNVRLNWRIIQAPMSLVDYVVAHELVHLLHEDHGREFWATLGRVMPDYDDRRERLRKLGPSLVW